jgi:hypothetical protein
VLYKLLIANRLKPLMVKLISPVQTSFVPGRKINENILIAQGQKQQILKSGIADFTGSKALEQVSFAI